MGGELGVDPTPGGTGGDHADVMEVRHQHRAALDDAEPVVGAGREQAAVELLGEADRPPGDVAHVHHAMIGEGGRMATGIGEEGLVVEERFSTRRPFDRPPVALLETGPDLRPDEAVELIGIDAL